MAVTLAFCEFNALIDLSYEIYDNYGQSHDRSYLTVAYTVASAKSTAVSLH